MASASLAQRVPSVGLGTHDGSPPMAYTVIPAAAASADNDSSKGSCGCDQPQGTYVGSVNPGAT